MTSLLPSARSDTETETSKQMMGKTEEKKEAKHELPEKMKAVVLEGPKRISLIEKSVPTFDTPRGELQHAVIIRIITSAICGSDLHAYNGRIPPPTGLTLGHENFGEVVKKGPHVVTIHEGDLVLVPFNISCGICQKCKTLDVQACQCPQVNPQKTGGIYGYALAGDWDGGQSQYLLVPYADFNCFKVNPNEIRGRVASITLMSDVLPTALHAVSMAHIDVGSTVYIAGAGPIGCAAAHFASLKGAAAIIVGDVNEKRLEKCKKKGFLTIDVRQIGVDQMNDELKKMIGCKWVDCAIDAVGFEASAQGHGAHLDPDRTAAVNACIQAVKPGGIVSIPGVYLPHDPVEQEKGPFKIDMETIFMKALKMSTGQTPCMPYLSRLYQSIIHDRTNVNDFLNIEMISLDQVSHAYQRFASGEDVKFICDPNGLFAKYNGGS